MSKDLRRIFLTIATSRKQETWVSERMDWQDDIRNGWNHPGDWAKRRPDLEAVTQVYPMRINRYLQDVLSVSGAPLEKQFFPDPLELQDTSGLEDPLGEERDSPVPNLTHRYPDRVLLLVTLECAVYCRFCTRKRKVGHRDLVTDETIRLGMTYIKDHPEIRDVLVSGGDPLMLSDRKLAWILDELRGISHVEVLRIGTRIPGVLPQRITTDLIKVLRAVQPIYLNLHFNHPGEITEAVEMACLRLADAGIVLSSQTVLLRGINDDPDTLETLFRMLLRMRVRPYYLLQGDTVKGANHFRTRIETGIKIMDTLQGRLSGLAIPKYMIDLPNGGGKVPILPEFVVEKNRAEWVVKNYKGEEFHYPQVSID